ncbi:ras-related protein Rab-32 isoform X1 [Cylas formicarius]|uniref:ras-related protein Rab-32 isoform X1 n=2 Tax=Cylas formicarius TaxID=197179 RepID=UPI002958419B|nr:ras-related protein Rab-32 isoform X1 [Cylas formicarius]
MKNEQEDVSSKRVKKVVLPPKSPKSVKLKRAASLIKKLKLKSKNPSGNNHPDTASDIPQFPLPATSSVEDSDPTERQTPEGVENFVLTKSASEANLKETWKSSERLDQDGLRLPSTQSAIAVENTDFFSNPDKKVLPERTKSLDNLKTMPAYGELILDPASANAAVMSNANQSSSKPKDHLYKILVIGDLGTGKTSIIKRYVHRFFTQHYRATIGVDFALKVLHWDENTLIRLQLWDIAGQERYGNMTRVYYKEAVGAFIVFDVTRRNTFESVTNWKSDLDSKVQLPNGAPIPCVLLANKCDQQEEGIITNPGKMDDYCAENGFTAWFETSARDNINIDEAAKSLVEKILEFDNVINNDVRKGDQFSLTKDSTQANGRKFCSC